MLAGVKNSDAGATVLEANTKDNSTRRLMSSSTVPATFTLSFPCIVAFDAPLSRSVWSPVPTPARLLYFGVVLISSFTYGRTLEDNVARTDRSEATSTNTRHKEASIITNR